MPFPTYKVGENKNASKGPNYPSTLPTPWVVSSGQIITPLGTQVYLGTTTRAKAVALNPTGNHTAAVLQMGAPQAVTIFNTQTGAVLQTYSPAAGKDPGRQQHRHHLYAGRQVPVVQPGRQFRYGQLRWHCQRQLRRPLSDYAHVSVPMDVNSAGVLTTVTCFPTSVPGTTGSDEIPCGQTVSIALEWRQTRPTPYGHRDLAG